MTVFNGFVDNHQRRKRIEVSTTVGILQERGMQTFISCFLVKSVQLNKDRAQFLALSYNLTGRLSVNLTAHNRTIVMPAAPELMHGGRD